MFSFIIFLAHIKRFFIHKYLQRHKVMIDYGKKKLAVVVAALVLPDTVTLPMAEVIVKVSDALAMVVVVPTSGMAELVTVTIVGEVVTAVQALVMGGMVTASVVVAVGTTVVVVRDAESEGVGEAETETVSDSEPVVVIVSVAVGLAETELGVWMSVVPDPVFVDEVGGLGMGGKIGTNFPPGPLT